MENVRTGNPLVSVIMPAWNESNRLLPTIQSLVEARSVIYDLEVVVVDDASTDGCCTDLMYKVSQLDAPRLSLKVLRSDDRVGVYRTRNQGAAFASGTILFITDAHVHFCKNWDRQIFEHLRKNRILAATIVDGASGLKGYGCSLMVPSMETRWNMEQPAEPSRVQVAACSGTVLYRELFERIGGYDGGMMLYGTGEPEFSVRAWLSGAEIVSIPVLEVQHRFKPGNERRQLLSEMRPFMIHNRLRFGLLYLSDLAVMQMLRYVAAMYPDQSQEAFKLVEKSDVWQRKAFLKRSLVHTFDWFTQLFGLKDQRGHEIL